MSISTEGVQVPQWDLADRMRKSLRTADLSVQEMADYLDVSRNTVSAWINGRTPPGRQTIRLWALRTAVPFKWLDTGANPDRGPGDDRAEPPGGIGPPPIHYEPSEPAPITHLYPAPSRQAAA